MGWMDEYYKALRKKKDEDEEQSSPVSNSPAISTKPSVKESSSFMERYNSELARLNAEDSGMKFGSSNFTLGSYSLPEREEEEEKGIFDGWFKSSDSDSIAKTILGSGADLLSDIGTGLIGIGEKAVDAMAYIAPFAADAQFYQNGIFDLETEKAHRKAIEQSKEDIGKFIGKDLYDEEAVAKQLLSHFGSSSVMTQKLQNGGVATQEDWDLYNRMQGDASKYINENMEGHSVFDEKSDSLVQSAGQLLGTSALAAMGIPADVVIGLTSFGSEAENALNNGANYEEAGFSAAVSAGAEILTEKISGGIKFGGKTLDDAATKWLARNVSNKALRTGLKMGMDMAGEGFEEVLSGYMGAIGQKLSYMDEKELSELFTKEDAWESFIGGAALGLGGNVVQTANSAANGVDAVTELTKNEQKVVDRVYKDELAKEKGKLTEKQKAKIYDRVLKDMEKGYISTDTIEEVLGGETYDRYKKAAEWEKSLQSEYDELHKMKRGDMTGEQIDREAALKKQLDNVKATSTLDQMKSQLGDEVFNLTKGDRLTESYNESARTKQKFEADLTQYDTKYHAAIQRAIDSGVLNNTNRSHELVDFAAKLEADKGYTIDFTNNKRIKETGFAVDGKIVNGYKTDSGIAINVQSPKYLESTVGHEITHVLEGTDFYNELQETIFKYAESKGEYLSRLEALTKLYEGRDADIKAELTADLVGDYIFSDTDFVNKLSTENRDWFDKIFDEIKYFCKIVTAGSKEARQLEKVKKVFEDAYRANGNAKSDTKYSVSDKNIKDVSTGYAYDETYFTMSYTQDGKVVATLEYGEYDGQPNVKMIEVEPEYRRKGIATKLMQELQRKYPDTEINFGMSTPDGSKLLDSITYDVTDEAVVADRQKLKDLQAELDELQEKLDILYDTENLTEEQHGELESLGDRWQEVYETIFKLSKDLRGKKATRTYVKTDTKYSLGYHAGDLGKSEDFYHMVGRGRGTGHFGTGTYFVGDEAKISDSYYGKRPHEKVDFDKYNLYKVRDNDRGYNLHRFLQGLNDNIMRLPEAKKTFDEYYDSERNVMNASEDTQFGEWTDDAEVESNRKIIDEYIENSFSDYEKQMLSDAAEKRYNDAQTATVTEYDRQRFEQNYKQSVKYFGISETLEEYVADSVRSREESIAENKKLTVEDWYYLESYDFLKEHMERNEEYRDWYRRLSIGAMKSGFYFGEDKLHGILDDIYNTVKDYGYDGGKYLDSASTMFMKALGYEGIDVRGTGLDNTSYGSVIYDLKGEDLARKKEIGTAKYSLSEADETYFDAVVNRDWETAERLVEDAAKKAGYTRVVYHGTDARFTEFDTDEESTAREQHAWMADYPDGTIFLAEDYDVADGYGERVMNLLLDTSDMKVFEEPDMYAHRAMDDKYGYEVYNYPVIAVKGKDMTIYATLDNTLVKSADTVTYGDGGEIIFPSERFKRNNPDIRYSLSDNDYLDAVNRGDTDTAQKMVDERAKDVGYSVNGYHGTTNLFYVFDTSKSNIENDWGRGIYATTSEEDAQVNYASEDGADLTNRIERLAEMMENWEEYEDMDYEQRLEAARKQLSQGESAMLNVAFRMENPVVVERGYGGTFFTYESEYDEDFDEYSEPSGTLIDVIEHMKDIINEDYEWASYDADHLDGLYEEALDSGGLSAIQLQSAVSDVLVDVYDEDGNIASNEILRAAFERMGFDGIVDKSVPYKFGALSGKRYGGMQGVVEGTTHFIAFDSSQVKLTDPVTYDDSGKVIPLSKRFNPDSKDIRYSISKQGEAPYGRGTLGKDVAYVDPNAAPIADNSTVPEKTQLTEENSTVTPAEMADMFPDNLAPVQDELERLEAERNEIYGGLEAALEHGSDTEVGQLAAEYDSITARIRELEADENQRTDSLTDDDIPPEMEAPYTETTNAPVENPFEDREWNDVVGKAGRKAKAYMYEHPEVKPFFQAEAQNLLGEWSDTQRGERIYNDQLHYDSGGEKGWTGIKRMTSQSMETLLDEWGMSYGEIEKGLKAIIEDHGAENISAAKKIEFMLNDRLLNGYKNFYDRGYVQPNQDYINLLEEMQINSYSKEAFDAFMATADQYAPADIAPVLAKATPDTMTAPLYESKDKNAVKGQTTMFEPPKPNPKVATVLTEESAIEKEKSGIGMKLASALVDKGMVFENLSLKKGNRELQAKWNYALPSNTEARAQYFMENGANGVKSLKDIQKKVDKSGKADDFFNYLYHVHNIDRMTLDERFGVENKTVFGETVTADVSRRKVAQFEKANPEFKNWANDVYAYNRHLRNLLVENSVISQDTADLWEKMYPHYVPIRRVDAKGQNISVPLDTNKTGVNNPIKKATGGSSAIQPVFATMAQRTEQTYRAIARNAFGIELKNTLGSTLNSQKNTTGVDETIDTLVSQEDHLLKPGAFGNNPTFTVFENGERVEFEITEDMFDALKPAGKLLGYRNKAINAVGNARRNLLTTLNPVFALYRNPIKDMQDVAINSQHATRTYLNVPYSIVSLAADTKVAKAIFGNTAVGKYASEYHQNGGKSNTYFDSRTNQFKAEDNIFKKTIGLPIRAIETAGEFIEEIPRLAEYIASRQNGRSVERSMLDAARVTTNFAAGGDFTKFLNSHGFTFLNASVQGVSQHVRNFREAKQQGLKGYVKVLAKYAIAGLPTILLNSMLWDDDEEYEELSDYVKQNYYVVAKTEDGKFVRIPKGRTAAVMGELMNQMQNLVTGDDEADFTTFYELFMNNIAPNNPIENNILAPIMQVKNNEAWYGGDLVPSRLQDLPAAEQFDESTDSISKWLGEKTNTSPYKWNYLLDQYSGGLGDMVLPTLTPEAESGDNSLKGNILAPWKKEITTDMVLNNKNPGDFYDLKDELEKLSNSKNATEEDSMRSMYMDSVSWEMGDLYAQKREWQNSGFSDAKKYEKVREIQEQINELAKAAMEGYNDVSIDGLYSEVGDRRYNKDAESGKWYEIREKNSDGTDNYYYQKEQEVTQALGISYGEYWNNREEYNYAYDKPEQYALSQAVGGYDSYRGYTSKLWDIKADKDENGKSINGSRKDKVIDYLNELDIDYYHKIILFKNEYNADDTYNEEIIDYLNGRDDISYQQMETILKYLGFDVDSEGNISWD